MTAAVIPGNLAAQLRRSQRRKKAFAISLTLPLLIFLLVTFIVPIGALLMRAVENPEVAGTVPHTVAALKKWDRKSVPPDEAYAAMITDLSAISEQADAGGLARRLNSEISGARSLVMSTYRALPFDAGLTPAQVKARMLELDPRWEELGYWQAIAKNGSLWTPDYLLASIDMKRNIEGKIVNVDPESAAFFKILMRTFSVSAVVTLFCLLLGYPLAYWLSTLAPRQANILMILVLVPFWTSVLVRSAAWIVLLQTNG
ncbi:MAG TPA: ABC transporter permease, partial [Rhodoferax sp.]